MPSNSQLRAWLHQPLTAGFLTTLLQTSGWLLWAWCATTVASRVHRRVSTRLRWRIALRMPAPMQGLAAALLGATAVTSTALPAAAHATSTADTSPDSTPREDALAQWPAADRPAPDRIDADRSAPVDLGHAAGDSDRVPQRAAGHSTVVSSDASRTARGPSTTRRADTSVDRARSVYTCVVRDGDTLSAIAKRWLGEPDRWPEIWALNRGTHFATVGGTFTDPDLIYPGWTLALPADAAPPGAAGPAPTGQAEPDPSRTQEPPSPVGPTGDPATGEGSDTPPSPTTSAAAPSAAAGTPSSRATRTPPPATSSPAESSRPEGITVGSGSWLDLGLATAIAAAASLVWAWRRRRYQPRPPGPHSRSGDPDLTPMPPIVTRVRRALRRPATDNAHGLDILDAVESGQAAYDNDRVATDDDTAEHTPVDCPEAADQPLPHAAPVVPAQDHPLRDVWPPAGLGLTGPGADAAGRGFLTAALAGGVNTSHAGGRVVIPAPTAAALLGTATALPETGRLTVTAGLDDALNVLETQTLHRSRLVYQHEVDTTADLRHTARHEEPPPPILFITHASARHERARIAALLAQGQRLDIHGVLLGAWPDGDTVVVATDGTTHRPDGQNRHGVHPADVGRLAVLTPEETIDLITTLAEAHTGERPTPTPDGPTTATTTQCPQPQPDAILDADNRAPHEHTDAPMPAAGEVPPTSTDDPVPASDTTVPPAATDSRHRREDGPGSDDPQPQERVAVRVLGDARIVDIDTTVPLRAKSLELLVYLVVHDGDAAQDNILDDLLPDAPAAKAPHRLHTYVSALRKTLARTGGPASYVTHPSRRYTLHREAFDTDLWRMRDALRDAERATTDADRAAALRRAVNAYGGALADGFDYEWIEVHREGIRRQALDAHLALAAATADPAEALTVLDTAMRHDPYAEPLYQQAMRAHAALGHLDEIRALRRTLTRRLDEIDAEPSEDTIDLADRLIAGLQQRRPAGRPRPRDGGRRA
ncbi:LysM peptidoglycan-binding domain-containing protein [Micromonospora craniellae]|uniref:LysM peptidoglycan-binding domain-containing protein n=2 Tax=Micromonospora craniellae TaxID=2294034 RepID=A0A372FRI1_9ACTN|nr:LysM peptidoglycan-binding domain-containing protein [Micromonospora craniellae]RFS43343.1 LysM peptidoglycan-binding domain-containing protein [Micromonospora craniellae]